jgi:hypothetical protein
MVTVYWQDNLGGDNIYILIRHGVSCGYKCTVKATDVYQDQKTSVCIPRLLSWYFAQLILFS